MAASSAALLPTEVDAENLSSFHIKGLPDTAYYIPNFITEQEEQYLFEKVYDAPKPKWVQLAHRRLQNWGGIPHSKGMIPEHLPPWLVDITKKVSRLGVFGTHVPNHVLVNEYKPGEGIMPHEDGPLYYPVVTTVNLNSHAVLNFYRARKPENSEMHNGQQSAEESERTLIGSLLLQRRSLLITKDNLYTDYLHGIDSIECDTIGENVKNIDCCMGVVQGATLHRDNRVSLTIRVVSKVIGASIMKTLKMNLYK
ncbi:alpha-ketoglutarate-dependent dioxygenase alkB homolog 6-like [Ornithodoros turicata]|uniref:alpha-ketoglutarate-dependent dioxygenase alkB homolog 6-like n=1 Tax=Ornithodoros turicata TaxID=34597 RepID=UPI00313969DB